MLRNFLKKNTSRNLKAKLKLRKEFSMSPNPKFFLLRFSIKSKEELDLGTGKNHC